MNAIVNIRSSRYHKSEQQFKHSFEQFQNSILVCTFKRRKL